jgi:hypothetical protein
MLGQVRAAPLVSGHVPTRIRGSYGYWLGPLTAGLLTGSALVAAAVTGAGRLIGTGGWPVGVRTAVLAGALVIFAGFDTHAFARGTVSRLGFARQTPQRLKYNVRRGILAFGWGTDIGSGVSTYRVTSAVWLVSLALLLGLVPAWTGLLYGVGLALVLGAAILSGVVGPAVAGWLDPFMTARRWLQGLHLAAAVVLAALTVPAVVAWIS